MDFDGPPQCPLRVGIVGTGFAAKMRIEAFQADARAVVVAVAGHTLASTESLAQAYGLAVSPTWQALVARKDIDLVVVSHVNRDHGEAVRAALTAGKSVVVEYPLALSPAEAVPLIALAEDQRSLLHIEHIELLGGLHLAMQTHLSHIGTPTYVRYCTAVPQRPAPAKWTYDANLFGFPLAGALSRLHRLTHLFGPVQRVSCQMQYDQGGAIPPVGYFKNCRCVAHLQFHSGVIAEVLYAKGEQTWRSQRWMEVEGDRGALIFDGDVGTLIGPDGSQPLEVGSRRGLFAKDTVAVLDALFEGKPLYVTSRDSLYALQVAAAAEESALTGECITVEGAPLAS